MAYSKNRRAASNSIDGERQAIKDADAVIDWPVTVAKYISDEDQGLAELTFQQILKSRAASDWRMFDLISSASLARACTDCFKLEAMIDAQGWVIEGEGSKGQPVQKKNVLVDALVVAQGQRARLSTQLGLTGAPDRPENIRNRATAATNKAKNNASSNDPYGLLA